jgi:hypothetical protein
MRERRERPEDTCGCVLPVRILGDRIGDEAHSAWRFVGCFGEASLSGI